ncbi:MAG: hypothetical protein V4472_25625 [Pseudomonadota bacterium]
MSYSTVLAVTPDRRPTNLAQFSNSHGWAPSIWRRLLVAHGHSEHWITNDTGLNDLWKRIENLPEWQQIPLVLTFDTGVIPYQAFGRAADMLAEFDKQLPSPETHVNHVPAMVELLRGGPECPLIGVHGTSVSQDPFDPWDEKADAPGSGISLDEMYVLERHRDFVAHAEGGDDSPAESANNG